MFGEQREKRLRKPFVQYIFLLFIGGGGSGGGGGTTVQPYNIQLSALHHFPPLAYPFRFLSHSLLHSRLAH